jgi:hypothetical protein
MMRCLIQNSGKRCIRGGGLTSKRLKGVFEFRAREMQRHRSGG